MSTFPSDLGPGLLAKFLGTLRAAVSGSASARDARSLIGRTAVAQVVNLAATPVVTRMYAPADLGRANLYLAAVALCSVVCCLQFETAIISGKDREEARQLGVLSLLLIVPMSILGGVATLVAIRESWLGLGALPQWSAGTVMVSTSLMAVSTVLRFVLIRDRQFEDVAIASLSQAIVRTGGQVGLGLGGASWVGLMAGDAIGRSAGIRRMTVAADVRLLRGGVNLAGLLAAARKYRAFPVLGLPSSLINTSALILPVPLVTRAYGAEAAGLYVLAFNMVTIPFIVFGSSTADFIHSRFARYAQEDPAEALPFMLRVGTLLATGAVAMVGFLAVVGGSLFGTLFGTAWSDAGKLATALAPWAAAQFVVGPLARAVFVFEGQRSKLVYDGLTLVGVVSALTMSDWAGWGLVEAARLLGVTQATLYAVYFVILMRVVRSGSATTEVPSHGSLSGDQP